LTIAAVYMDANVIP